MGLFSSFISRMLKAKPFPSELLDRLAETMHAIDILSKNKLERYYKVGTLQASALSYIDKVFFDKKYLEMLSSDELRAVGAHEFTHVKNKHGTKRFIRVLIPPITISAITGFFVFLYYALTDRLPPYNIQGTGLFSMFVAASLFILALVVSSYINAKWNRQLETQCDLSAIEFADGEAMISALIKASKLHPINEKSLLYRLLPKSYPPLDQRINDIRTAQKKSE